MSCSATGTGSSSPSSASEQRRHHWPIVPPAAPPPPFDDARDLLRRKDIRFTSEPLGPPPRGFVRSAGRGGSGQALPFLPQGLTAP